MALDAGPDPNPQIPTEERVRRLEERLAQAEIERAQAEAARLLAEVDLRRAEERAARLESVLETIGQPVVLVDSGGQVEGMLVSGQELGVEEFGRPEPQWPLHPGDILQNMPAGVMVVNADLNQILFCNTRAFELLEDVELTRRDAIRQLVRSARRPDGTQFLQDERPLLKILGRGKTIRGEEILLDLPNGRETSLLVSGAPISIPGYPEAVVVVFEDITLRKHHADALRASEERLRLAHEAAGLGAWEWRPDWKYSINNEIYFHIHGLEPTPDGHVLFVDYLPYVHPDDRERLRMDVRRAMTGEPGIDAPFRFIRPDGETRWFQSYRKNIYEGGTLVRQIGAVRDITDQVIYEQKLQDANQALEEIKHTLETSEARFRLLVSSMEDTVFTLDTGQRYTGVFGRALARYGVVSEMFMGKDPVQILGEEDAQVHINANQRALAGEEVVYEWSPPASQGSVFFQTQLSQMLGEQGEVVGIVAVSRDITDIKRAETELEEYALKLEESNRELQNFAFVASHDLQEPLRKIRSFADSLHRHASGKLDESELDVLERMRAAAERMNEMIRDLLELSRVSTQGRPFMPVDLHEVAEEVLSDLEVQMERTQGQVELGSLPVVLADEFQMRQLLQNLIGNALKYHRSGVPPQVKVYVDTGQISAGTPRSHHQVRLVIADNGIGFDPAHTERIFQPFQRLHGRSQYEGTGMGLAICKKIAERHGGSLSATSIPGEGSQFIVTLPADWQIQPERRPPWV